MQNEIEDTAQKPKNATIAAPTPLTTAPTAVTAAGRAPPMATL